MADITFPEKLTVGKPYSGTLTKACRDINSNVKAELLAETLSDTGLSGSISCSCEDKSLKYINLTITGTPTKSGQFYYQIKLADELIWKINVNILESN